MPARYSINKVLAMFILVFGCTACGADAHSCASEEYASMLGPNGVVATFVGNSRFDAKGPQIEVEALATAAMGMYEQAAEEQAVPNAAQLKAMDRAFQDAENKINLVAPLKYNRTLQLRKLFADMLDRLVWGGSFLAAGFGLSALATRCKRWSRLLMAVSMVLLGCAYALLLPIMAVGVVVAFVIMKRGLIATIFQRADEQSANSNVEQTLPA